MFGISWFEFLVIIIVSFICLKPSDFARIVRAVRDMIRFFNSLITETKDKLDQSLTLEEFKIEEFYVIDKKDIKKAEPSQMQPLKRKSSGGFKNIGKIKLPKNQITKNN
ncbi:MAG: hypothetical protein FWE18_03910 [Alphaproteobacteria bacterium]|nr:hypothetical protein [Alphaproteobacteria bacterium]